MLPPKGTQFYGYWYSHYCDVGNVQGCPSSCTLSGSATYTAPGVLQKGLYSVEDMVAFAQQNVAKEKINPFDKFSGINTTASLGIGAPPSNGEAGVVNYTWQQLLCPQSTTVQSVAKGVPYNIMNIGGWGPGNTPILWQREDVDLSDADVDVICTFLHQNHFQGISFDLEGLSPSPTGADGQPDPTLGWNSADPRSNASLLNRSCGKILAKGYMVWVVLPAFNVSSDYNGPLLITDWSNITLVQLMCYGKGLDSLWGGDPRGKPISPESVDAVIDALLESNGTPEQIMLAYSYNTGGYSQQGTAHDAAEQQNAFLEMVHGPGQRALAGCMAWCKGNEQVWTWSGKAVAGGSLGSCDTKAPGPAPAAECEGKGDEASCTATAGCIWANPWSGTACVCHSNSAGSYKGPCTQ